MSEKLVLIDGHSILNRAFYGMPDLTNSKGVHTGAVYGFLNIMFRILDEEKPDYLTVAFDVHAPTFRHKAYSDYKGTRHPMPEELTAQVPLIKEVLHAMDVFTIEQEGLEADDIMGTLAKRAQKAGMEVSLVSGDRDLLQISDDHILIRIPKTKKGITTIENYYPADVQEALGVSPLEFIQVKALQGDTADNIPGVPKVGPKTATELIQRYKTVAGVYDHLDEITKKALHENLANNRDKADLSLFLATIKTDCELTVDMDKAKVTNFYTTAAYELFTELGFKRLLSRFDQETTQTATTAQTKFEYSLITTRKEAEKVFTLSEHAQEIAVHPIFDVPHLKLPDELLGLALAFNKKAYFIVVNGTGKADQPAVPLGQLTFDFGGGDALDEAAESAAKAAAADVITSDYLRERLKSLRLLAREGKMRLDVFHLKTQYPFWNIEEHEFNQGIDLTGFRDLLLEAYLLNPLKNDYEPENIASEYAGETIVGKKQLLDKSTFAQKFDTDREEVASFAAHIAWSLLAAADPIGQKLEEEGMKELYEKMELPLSYILFDMQRIGIRILPDRLKAYGDQLVGRITELEEKIHEAAGEEFNIASPKQLGEILFEKMHLPGGKKTKTGYSTAADVLEKLAPDYPIVNEILEYRGLTKLKSTYADGLAAYIADDSRIHTTFHQTITATGRLSSADPNLQNIPMRTELGRAIRKVFVPGDGWKFMDADYSQIELRILASLSGDEALIEAFNENRDIHRTTASKVFHVPFDEVTPVQRRDAKAVNFGIVYGISSFGLSQNLSISRQQAAEYINEYFNMFPGIKSFLDGLVLSAKENGYSVTMFQRRRPIPELKNSNFMQRQFGERVAMNAPIQGTGADIIKIGMIRVWEGLHRAGLKSRLILQIHDELLIEVAPGEDAAVEKILVDGMTGAANLKVRLDVDAHEGTDWFEAK